MKVIGCNWGTRLTLDFGNDRKHDVIVIHVVQFIIGDCNGNDLLSCKKGGHYFDMKVLCVIVIYHQIMVAILV